MRVNGVVVAAGEGKRIGKGIPKPLLPIAGRPIILHTLSRFAASQVHRVIVVTGAKDVQSYQKLIEADVGVRSLDYSLQPGGLRRQDSVWQGLAHVDADCEVVVIHDGARPFIFPDLIDRSVEIALKTGAVIVGVPVRSTIKIVSSEGRVASTPPRDTLWEIQTPQVFRLSILREAYEKAMAEGLEATDDATLVERLGKPVYLLEGHPTNIKITIPEDMILAEALIREGRVPI